MLYVLMYKGVAVGVSQTLPKVWSDPSKNLFHDSVTDVMIEFDAYETRHDWPSFERAQFVAQQLSVNYAMILGAPKREFLGVDNGEGHWPRFDIVEIPRVGDEVSYYFNGDSYPCGKIARITPNLMVVTDTGKRFNRYKKTGGWMMTGGTWCLRHGHHYEQNPSV